MQSETPKLPSPADQDPSSLPGLPFELVLQISSFSTVGTRLKMSFACRDWYPALFPFDGFKDALQRKLEDWKGLDDEEQVRRLKQDSVGIGKFRAVDYIKISSYVASRRSWLLRVSILASCTSLSVLRLHVSNTTSKFQDLTNAATVLANVVTLVLEFSLWGEFFGENDLVFPFPALTKLDYKGEPEPALFSVILRSCPLLDSLKLCLTFSGELDVQFKLDQVPDDFWAKVWCSAADPIDIIFTLSDRESFRPRKLDLWQSHGSETESLSNEEWARLWVTVVRKLDSLEEIAGIMVPIGVFELGLPNNIKAISFMGFTPSMLPMDRVLALEQMFRSHPARISIGWRENDPEPGPEASPSLIAFNRERNFWNTVFKSIDEENRKRENDRE